MIDIASYMHHLLSSTSRYLDTSLLFDNNLAWEEEDINDTTARNK
jgi:hypothetical protein